MKRKTTFTLGALLLGVLGTVVATWLVHGKSGSAAAFRTAVVTRGSLATTISATGTIEPEEVVDVGAQVGGQINLFGKDKDGRTIDYGSVVEEGTVLAQIDDSLYRADAETASAQLEQARASHVRAEADLLQWQARLDQARRDWERAQKLGPSEALAPTTFDAYKAGYETSRANVAVGEAAIAQAKAAIAQAQATLAHAQRNLEYCTIKAPVRGVIIDRRVNIGQTVVSSLNAPSLFLIAKDLQRLQVWVSVNEADIGTITPGQVVTFTVDAFPGQVFHGQVNKTRLNASMTQNVVTYTVEVTTDNAGGTLLPYLTANARFETGRHDNLLLVPNAALRWMPRPELIAPPSREHTGATAASPQEVSMHKSPSRLWVDDGGFARPVNVTVGLSDGLLTQVEGDGLSEGMPVIVGDAMLAAGSASVGASPFTPQLFGRPRGGNP